MKHRYLVILFVLSNLVFACSAFGKEIAGRVRNTDDKPVVNAVVSLYELPDTAFVSLSQTDTEGIFRLNVPDTLRNSLCRVEARGYSPVSIENIKDRASLTLTPSGNTLKEVVVTRKKQSLKIDASHILYDPAELKGAAANAIDVLSMMPLVSFRNDQAYIFGSGNATIFINGKPPRMAKESLLQYLRSMPLDYIKRVEVIPDPGARYSSENSRGIVNLIIDDQTQGYRGTVSGTASYMNERFSENICSWNGLALGKFNLTLSPFYDNSHYHTRVINTYDFYQQDIHREVWSKQCLRSQSLGTSLNLDYTFNKNLWIGAYTYLIWNRRNNNSDSRTKENIAGEENDIWGHVRTRQPFSSPLLKSGIYGEWTIDKQSTLNLSADYGSQPSKFYARNEFGDEIFNESSIVDTQMACFDMKYQYRNEKFGRISAGYSFSYSNMEETLNQIGNNRIKETVNSLYVEYFKSLLSNLSLRVGLRAEYYNRHTAWEESGSFRYDKLNWYPSLRINWDLGRHRQNITLSYDRRSYRPSFDLLNPIRVYTSEYAYSCGNPFLNQTQTNFVRLSYSLKDMWYFYINFMNTGNGIGQFRRNDGIYTVTGHANCDKLNDFSLGAQFTKNLFKFIRTKFELDLYKMNGESTIFGKKLITDNYQATFGTNLTFILPPKYRMSATVNYYLATPFENDLGKTDWKNLLSVSIQKQFGMWGILQLSAFDLLNYKPDPYYRDADAFHGMKTLSDGRSYTAQLTIYFGKKRIYGTRYMSNEELESRYAK